MNFSIFKKFRKKHKPIFAIKLNKKQRVILRELSDHILTYTPKEEIDNIHTAKHKIYNHLFSMLKKEIHESDIGKLVIALLDNINTSRTFRSCSFRQLNKNKINIENLKNILADYGYKYEISDITKKCYLPVDIAKDIAIKNGLKNLKDDVYMSLVKQIIESLHNTVKENIYKNILKNELVVIDDISKYLHKNGFKGNYSIFAGFILHRGILNTINREFQEMPIPTNDENKEDFVKRCIPILIKEGKDQKQATAICYSIFNNAERQIEVTTTANIAKYPFKIKFKDFLKSELEK